MICPMCGGKRTVYRPVVHEIKLVQCPMCEGRGEIVHTNFDRITASPEKLAELIADAIFLYSTNRHIYTIEAVIMANKKEGININLDCVYKDVVDWLKEESDAE